ncbi:hypothetical protein [Streptomyces genisteinicus]|uniref:hypothetical protein n=1 Tax=Streptomyces genisteinicus TaxID=2768068 RepID=UPI001FE98B31|nr:hypothetical protein [Streptomyces genisteinicus]
MTNGGTGPYGPTWRPEPYGPQRSPWRQVRDGDWPTLRELLTRVVQVNSCLWLPMILCFSGPVLSFLTVYPLIRSARHRARLRFPSHDGRTADRDLLRVQTARAWLALVASFGILAVFGTSEDWSEAQQQYWIRLVATPWLLLLTAPLVIWWLFRSATATARTGLRTRLRPVVRSVLWFFGAFTAFAVLAGLMVAEFGFAVSVFSLGFLEGGGLPLVPVLADVALYGAVLWLACFLWFASGPVVRGVFGTAEVHAALPALLTGVLVWELSLISLAVSGLPPGPLPVQIAALLGGPASVTAVAWWEIDRLRRRHGVSLRA